MQYRSLFLASLVDVTLASPIPQRLTPVIGVIIHSDVPLVDPKFGMGDTIERPAPAAQYAPSIPLSTRSTTSYVNSTSTSASSTTTSATPTPVQLRAGSRFLGSGNIVTLSSSNQAGMGDAVERTKNGVKVAFIPV
jgi:hypothetical protein